MQEQKIILTDTENLLEINKPNSAITLAARHEMVQYGTV